MTSTSHRLAKNSLWNTVGWGGSLVINFFTVPLLISLLGTDHYGLFVLVMSIIAPLGLLDFGVSDATVKYLSESLALENRSESATYISTALIFNIGVGIAGAAVILIIAPFLVTMVFSIPEEQQVLAKSCISWIAILWCCTQVRQTFLGIITASLRYDLLNLGNLIAQGASLGIGVWILMRGGTLTEYIIVQVFFVILSGAAWIVLIRRVLPFVSLWPRFEKRAFRKTTTFGFWQLLNNLGGILTGQSQRWLLGITLSIATVGFFNVGMQIVNMVYMIAYRIGQVFFPEVSRMAGKGESDEAGMLMIRSNWFVALFSASVFIPLLLWIGDFLRLWVGQTVTTATAPVVPVLVIGTSIGCIFAIPNFYLLGTAKGKWLAGMSFIQGIITVIASAILIPSYGLTGAAWGYVSGTIVHMTVIILIRQKILRHLISFFDYAMSMFGPLIIGSFLFPLMMIAKPSGWIIHSWLEFFLTYGITWVITLILLIAIDRFLPGGLLRWKSLLNTTTKILSLYNITNHRT